MDASLSVALMDGAAIDGSDAAQVFFMIWPSAGCPSKMTWNLSSLPLPLASWARERRTMHTRMPFEVNIGKATGSEAACEGNLAHVEQET